MRGCNMFGQRVLSIIVLEVNPSVVQFRFDALILADSTPQKAKMVTKKKGTHRAAASALFLLCSVRSYERAFPDQAAPFFGEGFVLHMSAVETVFGKKTIAQFVPAFVPCFGVAAGVIGNERDGLVVLSCGDQLRRLFLNFMGLDVIAFHEGRAVVDDFPADVLIA